MRLINDLHGNPGLHIKLARRVDKSVQLGDCGFRYGYLNDSLDPSCHKVLAGNHDNLDILPSYPHYLGDFGVWEGVFFVRGAWSTDQARRQEGISWWANEELTIAEGYAAVELYKELKPRIVISHDCPWMLNLHWYGYDANKTRTNQLLQSMFEVHQPELWCFGHHHRAWDCKSATFTRFICMEPGGYLDFDTEKPDGKVYYNGCSKGY